jgi:type I restriction enzyme S subunit
MSSKPKTTTTQEDATPTLVPKLRFPEFRDAGTWGGRIVSQLAKVTTGAKDTQNKVEGGRYPFYVRSQTVENIDSYSYEGEAVLTSGDGVGVGKNFHYIKGKFDFHQRVYCIYDFDEGVSGLFFYLYFSEHFGKRVMRMSAKNSVDSVRMAMITEMPVTMPSLSEQQKIAECLSSVDELIAAQARKLDAIKTHKKGLMQQLFPREGETQPRLRFPEFQNAGEWVETKLGQLGELVSGLTYSPGDVRESGLLVLRSSNVQNGEIALDDNVYVDPTIKGANLSEPNDILICVRNGSKALIGKCSLIPKGMPFCTHGAFMTVFRARAPRFVFQLFQTNRYQKQVAGDLGATINSINGGQFLKYKFVVPKPPEQQRIADCLSSLDDLIAAQTQTLEALKTHKQGLMQQLFPSPSLLEP